MEQTLSARESGIGFWMSRVLERRENAAALASDPVHNLRTALRRCISIADGMTGIDPAPEWKKIRREAKRLFNRLGRLRDLHVFQTLAEKFISPEDTQLRSAFGAHLNAQLRDGHEEALRGLLHFDRRRWKSWVKVLPERMGRIGLDSPAFEHVALERFDEAFAGHRRAMRRPTVKSIHRLRVALKEFRYTVENFLPARSASWGAGLKQAQDELGELHDLDAFRRVVNSLPELKDTENLVSWNGTIAQERKQRIERYRERMSGANSLWTTSRAGLPSNEKLEKACVARLGAWASFLTPDFDHSRRIARLALRLYDGFASEDLAVSGGTERGRFLLNAAALVHDVGRAVGRKGHHKASYKLIRRMKPPSPWSDEELHMVALIARYHRRALPHFSHAEFRSLPALLKPPTLFLAGILRFAVTLDRTGEGKIRQITVEHRAHAILIAVPGLEADDSQMERLTLAKQLLERACSRSIEILSPVAHAPARTRVFAVRSRVA